MFVFEVVPEESFAFNPVDHELIYAYRTWEDKVWCLAISLRTNFFFSEIGNSPAIQPFSDDCFSHFTLFTLHLVGARGKKIIGLKGYFYLFSKTAVFDGIYILEKPADIFPGESTIFHD